MSESTFIAPVTFFVGETGSGKSTLLEAIPPACIAILIGSTSSNQDQTMAATRELSRRLKAVWNQNTHKGFFLRAEEFFG